MQGSYNLSLVALSILIAMLASYVALDLAERVAIARAQARGTHTWRVWLAAGAVAMGIGIWSMHFVGMLAFSLPLGMAYDMPLVALSVIVAILASAVALGVTSTAVLRLKTLLPAGFAMGIAIAGMHYIGMAAMRVDAILTYDPMLFTLSIVIAIVASIVALWLSFTLRREEEKTGHWPIRMGAAMIMGGAIAGMHYTGMAGARFTPNPGHISMHGMPMHGAEGGHLAAVGITAAALLVLVVALVSALFARREQQRFRAIAEQARADLAEQACVLERTTVQLLHAQKMETVGQLAGGVAHDFNNLLTAILSCSEFASSGVQADSPVQDDIRQIESAAMRAATLVRQLLAFSRQQVIQPRLLDLNTVLEQLLPMLRRLVPADVALVTKFGASAHIRADPMQIEQVLVNLTVNARDAMPDGGTLTIETVHTELEADGTERDVEMSPGDYVQLTVSDTGIGMDLATQARIFEPFFTTKEQGKGTGLGLASVYGIVKQSNGSIRVSGQLGKGTRFSIYLPSEHGQVEDLSSASVSVPGGSETILLAEDDFAVRTIAHRVLTKAGYTVLDAVDGAQALEIFEQYGDSIHLIVSDIVMPKMRGPELGRRVRALYPHMKLLFMSGYAQEFNVPAGNDELPTLFLGKPFTPQSLVSKVREALDASAYEMDGAGMGVASPILLLRR